MTERATAFDPTDNDALTRAVDKARAQVAAGYTIPLRNVADWLNSWGTVDERPAPTLKESSLHPPLPI